jgi:CheY-like chemotaxis protein
VAWRWDSAAGKLEPANLPQRVALLDRAAHRAADELRLAPASRAARRIYLAARVEAEATRAGVDLAGIAQPWPNGPETAMALLASEDAAVVDDLLDFALTTGHTVAARGAARALGELGHPEVLYRREPRPGFLVEAARQGDRRLRLDALRAVLRLAPNKPYPGSSFVVEALGYFVSTYGAPRVLAADARPLEVQSQAGLLADLGFETDVATTEREALAEAIGSPDYLFALIDYSLARATSGQLLERLRRDNRTARLPIGIVASSDDLADAARLARRTSLSMMIIRPVDSAGLDWQIKRLLAQAGESIVPIEERQDQAEQAARWLAELSLRQAEQAARWLGEPRRQTPDIYNLRRIEDQVTKALWSARLSQPTAQVLATLGTASSQRSLVDFASQIAQPLEARQAAVAAFAASVARFGTLLATGEISLQYERYNQSESQDADTQRLLASLLDTIELRADAEQTE